MVIYFYYTTVISIYQQGNKDNLMTLVLQHALSLTKQIKGNRIQIQFHLHFISNLFELIKVFKILKH